MFAEDNLPNLASGLTPTNDAGQELKRLDINPFRSTSPKTRQKAWQEVLRFLQSARQTLFTFEELPENYTQRELFAPQLSYPTRAAAIIYLEFSSTETNKNRDQFLFIEDVYYLFYQIWKAAEEEERYFNQKIQVAQKNRSTAEAEDKPRWESRLEVVSALLALLQRSTISLRSQFERYAFAEGNTRINTKLSDKLLEERHTDSRGSEYRNALDDLIELVKLFVPESGLDVGELPDAEPTPVEAITETVVEKPAETTAAVAAPSSETTAAETEAPEAGDTEDQTRQPEKTPVKKEKEEEPEKKSQTLQDIELNNLKIITIETERLSRIFLYQLAAEYGLPPELLQADNTGFRDTIREDMRQWIVKKLQAGELDALYDPNAIRERQLLVARFGEVLTRDGRFDLFQKILVKHHEQLNKDPAQQQAFRDELSSGKFQDAATWKNLLENFANGWLETESDPQKQTAANPRQAIASALKASLSSLAADIDGLGIADLNLADNPQIFNERLTTITTMIDVMVALRFAPIYLETLGREHFRDTFKLNVSESEYRSLVTVLQAYWDIRERSFTEQGVNLNYVLEGLDVDELEDWIEYMSHSSREEYYNRYLERLEYFAAVGHRVGGFHRVVLAMAPRKTKTDADGNEVEEDETAGLDEEDIKKLTAVNKAKLEVMRDSLAYAFSQLPDDAKRAVYNQIDPSQTDEWVKTGYFPVEISFNDLDLIAQYANELGITSPVASDAITSAGGGTYDPSIGPMGGTAAHAANSIRNANNRFQQFRQLVAKRRKKIAKQAAKKAAQATTKATAEVALNALGTALGVPGLGTVLVNLWYSIPEEIRPVIAFLLITGPLAVLGGLASLLFGLPSWLSTAGANVSSFFKNLFNPKAISSSAANAGGAFSSASANSATQAASAATGSQASLGATATKLAVGIHPAAQAVLISSGIVGLSSIFNYMMITNAFLANFPLPTEDKSINEKISKYVALEKTVTVPPPCDQATLKCPELSGGDSYEVTYTIKLTLKGDYTISINKIKDEITAKFSKKKFEELGQPLPSNIVITRVVIPNTETGAQSDFEELTTDPNDERNIIRPGEELLLTYTETYDSKFNNSLIRNIFHAEFFYVDGDQSGNDYVETAKSICIGDCSQEEGCWPATGFAYQGPWGRESHNLNNIGVDAYDISDPHKYTDKLKELGVPMDKMSNPAKIYSPFEAQACYPPFSSVYGNYVVLTTKDWVYWLGHMISRSQESGCQQVHPGDIVGVMGTTGQSGGVHSHFELRTLDGAVTVGRPDDPLGEQMPPSLLDNKPPHAWVQSAANPGDPWAEADYIGSCYDMD